MKAILDTHVFLWWNTADARLSSRLRELIAQARCEGRPILTADPVFRQYEGVEILF